MPNDSILHEVCKAKLGEQTPECDGKSFSVCKRMIRHENKCQWTAECPTSLIDDNMHGEGASLEVQFTKSKSNIKRSGAIGFLSPDRALVQVQQAVQRRANAPMYVSGQGLDVEL